jgi:hypothetical protein
MRPNDLRRLGRRRAERCPCGYELDALVEQIAARRLEPIKLITSCPQSRRSRACKGLKGFASQGGLKPNSVRAIAAASFIKSTVIYRNKNLIDSEWPANVVRSKLLLPENFTADGTPGVILGGDSSTKSFTDSAQRCRRA